MWERGKDFLARQERISGGSGEQNVGVAVARLVASLFSHWQSFEIFCEQIVEHKFAEQFVARHADQSVAGLGHLNLKKTLRLQGFVLLEQMPERFFCCCASASDFERQTVEAMSLFPRVQIPGEIGVQIVAVLVPHVAEQLVARFAEHMVVLPVPRILTGNLRQRSYLLNDKFL